MRSGFHQDRANPTKPYTDAALWNYRDFRAEKQSLPLIEDKLYVQSTTLQVCKYINEQKYIQIVQVVIDSKYNNHFIKATYLAFHVWSFKECFFLLLFSKNSFESIMSWAFRPEKLFEGWHFFPSCFWRYRKRNTTNLRWKHINCAIFYWFKI